MDDFGAQNRAILKAVARRIEPLLGEVVFVGGQVAALLVTSVGATRVRPTTDVDIVVEASTRLGYREVEERLTALGLANDMRDGAPICRWRTPDDLTLDVMPVATEVLGFANRWYPEALASAFPFDLGDGLVIRIPSAPVFLATKWEAFVGRGGSDVLASHDLEDVIGVLAGRPETLDEVAGAPPDLRLYLAERARELLSEDLVGYAIRGALPDSDRIPDLVPRTLERLRDLADQA